jgi:hypothetical protein
MKGSEHLVGFRAALLYQADGPRHGAAPAGQHSFRQLAHARFSSICCL